MDKATQILIKHLMSADMEYKEENIAEVLQENSEEGRLIRAMLAAINEALNTTP